MRQVKSGTPWNMEMLNNSAKLLVLYKNKFLKITKSDKKPFTCTTKTLVFLVLFLRLTAQDIPLIGYIYNVYVNNSTTTSCCLLSKFSMGLRIHMNGTDECH